MGLSLLVSLGAGPAPDRVRAICPPVEPTTRQEASPFDDEEPDEPDPASDPVAPEPSDTGGDEEPGKSSSPDDDEELQA